MQAVLLQAVHEGVLPPEYLQLRLHGLRTMLQHAQSAKRVLLRSGHGERQGHRVLSRFVGVHPLTPATLLALVLALLRQKPTGFDLLPHVGDWPLLQLRLHQVRWCWF